MKKSRIVLVLCMMVVIAVASVAGTIAWLTDTTTPVTNTFTTAGIDITLTEAGNQEDGSWSAQLIPGKEYAKNPVVAVDGDVTNVDVYLYVKFDASTSANYLDYTSTLNTENGWTLVNGQTNVWWREVKEGDATKSWHLLDGDKVTVKDELQKAGSETLPMPANALTMTYTAYAIQTEGFTPETGWTEVSKLGN